MNSEKLQDFLSEIIALEGISDVSTEDYQILKEGKGLARFGVGRTKQMAVVPSIGGPVSFPILSTTFEIDYKDDKYRIAFISNGGSEGGLIRSTIHEFSSDLDIAARVVKNLNDLATQSPDHAFDIQEVKDAFKKYYPEGSDPTARADYLASYTQNIVCKL